MVTVRKGAFGIVLLASLAFNAGLGVTFGVRAYNRTSQPSQPCDRRGGGDRTGGDRPGGGDREGDFFEALHLTDEQRAQFKTDREQLMQSLSPFFDQLRSASKAVTDLMSAEEPDRQAIATQLDQVAAIRRQMQQTVIESVLQSMSHLDAEQRKVFNEKFLPWVPMLGGWGPGPGGPGGAGGPGGHRGPSSHSDWRRPDGSDGHRTFGHDGAEPQSGGARA